MPFKPRRKGFATKAIHVGQEPEQWNSLSIIPPIVTSTNFKHCGFEGDNPYLYSRGGNPNRNVLQKCIASLDDAKYGLTFSSGQGATSAVLMLLETGDHIISSDDYYGGTNRLFRDVISRLGLSTTFVDMTDLNQIEKAFKSNTKLVWIESPTNPLTKIIDIEKVSQLAHKHKDVIVVVDNTFLTSYFQRPLELGADISHYSLSKYMNGHCDVIMGALTMNSKDIYDRLVLIQRVAGIVPGPFDCYQVTRGLKTLAIRMEQHQRSGFAVAQFLETHPFVEKVLHPLLPSHPQHELAKRQASGYSGVFSFYLKGNLKQSKKFVLSLKLIVIAGSLGGCDSLIELPTFLSHSTVPREIRLKQGITDSLVRISVGLEDVEDLIEDLQQALDAASKEKP